MKAIVHSKVTIFPQVGYAEREKNRNRKDDILGTSCNKIYTAGGKYNILAGKHSGKSGSKKILHTENFPGGSTL